MASNAVAQKGKFKGYGLVRNRQGQPQFNDWDNIPRVFHTLLSDEDWDYIKQQQRIANHGDYPRNN